MRLKRVLIHSIMQMISLCVFVLAAGVEADLKIELNNHYPAFDRKFYEAALDPVQCVSQLNYIADNLQLAFRFLDSSAKPPKGIWGGNLLDLGNYHQCLSINHKEDMAIRGKYCSVQLQLEKDLVKKFKGVKISPRKLFEEILLEKYSEIDFLGQVNSTQQSYNVPNKDVNLKKNTSSPITITLGVCIPKACSVANVVNSTLLSFMPKSNYSEALCRLPDDKLWSPADTTAVVLFAILGILTILSTSYDVICKFVLKKDAKQINKMRVVFSAYTNGCRLVNFGSSADSLRCLNGMRVMACLWVILGHTMQTQIRTYLNIMEFWKWMKSLQAVYITSAPNTVDTFFTITGILLVYTLCEKMTSRQLIRNLPAFYIHRLLRIFPLLATAVLLQASFFHRVSDGPQWGMVAKMTNSCRTQWWITLLYLQNYINVHSMCLIHSWYLSIDMHLYVSSPIILFWMLGKSRKAGWIALTIGVLAILVPATAYNFIHNFIGHVGAGERPARKLYLKYYYINWLTRASPFYIGMAFGYFLHTHRQKRVHLSWPTVAILWTGIAALTTTIVMTTCLLVQGSVHQHIINMMNSFMRPAWAVCIGCIVFACAHGYGGPVNWFLSLDVWRLPARLGYGVYLFHYPIMVVYASSRTNAVYFTVPGILFIFAGFTTVSFVASYFATLLIDAPFSTIFKLLFFKQRAPPKLTQDKQTKQENQSEEISDSR